VKGGEKEEKREKRKGIGVEGFRHCHENASKGGANASAGIARGKTWDYNATLSEAFVMQNVDPSAHSLLERKTSAS